MDRKPAKSYQDLIVWQKAHQLVLNVYRVTERFPLEERYGLISQMRRSATSVPANLVEAIEEAASVTLRISCRSQRVHWKS